MAAAAAHGLPLFQYKPESPASIAYVEIAKEIVKSIKRPVIKEKGTGLESRAKHRSLSLHWNFDL